MSPEQPGDPPPPPHPSGFPPPPPHLAALCPSLEERLLVVGGVFCVYLSLFLLSHLVSRAVSGTYVSLPPREKVFWNLAVSRAAFGLQGSAAGLRALTRDSRLSRDPVGGQEAWSWLAVLSAVGFFLFENVALHVSALRFRSLDAALAVHHFFALAGFSGTAASPSQGHFLPMVTLLLEVSTPCTCVSWILLKVGWSRSPLWRANQWLMVHLFHCRMVLTYYMWWVSFCHWGALQDNVSAPQLLLYFTGLTLLTLVLNPVWTHRKTLQLLDPRDWNHEHRGGASEDLKEHRS